MRRIVAVLSRLIDRPLRAAVKVATKNSWFFWPGLIPGSLGTVFGVIAVVFALGAYLWSGVSVSFGGTVVLAVYLAMVFVTAYLAGAHLMRLLGVVLVGLLGESARAWAIAPALLISAVLAFAPDGDVEDKKHVEAGGLAFLTSSSVSHLDIDVSPQDMRSTDRLVAVDVKVTAKGDASLALVGSGPAEFDAATLTEGYIRMADAEEGQQSAGSQQRVSTLSKRKLPLVSQEFEPLEAPDLVQMGDSGMYIAPDDHLAPELPGQWFAKKTARAFALDIKAAPETSYEHEFSFMLRLRPGLSLGLLQGDLGEIGCPSSLTSAFQQHRGSGSVNGLFRLQSASLPLVTPDSCTVRVLIAYGSNLSVNVAGQKREIDGYEPIILSAESKTSSGIDSTVLANNLTLVRSDWRLDDRKEKSPFDETWHTIKDNSIWAFIVFSVVQLWLALRRRIRRALVAAEKPSDEVRSGGA